MGLVMHESKQEVTKVVSLVKIAENLPDVSSHLKHIHGEGRGMSLELSLWKFSYRTLGRPSIKMYQQEIVF